MAFEKIVQISLLENSLIEARPKSKFPGVTKALQDLEIPSSLLKKATNPLKRTIRQLLQGYKRIFPRSNSRELKVGRLHITGKKAWVLHVQTEVKSSSRKGLKHKVHIILRRDELADAWDVDMKGEVKCKCEAFHYWMAYPDLKKKNFYGRPSKWNKVKNKVRNPTLVPGTCKHLMAVSELLIRRKIVTL